MKRIEELTVELSSTPEDPVVNFLLAEEYYRIDQVASAVSFYLRCAEFGHDSHPLHVYTSLLRISECFSKQGDRNWTVLNSILQAIAFNPTRPEAWFYLSRYYERKSEWQECYTYAIVGQSHAGRSRSPLPASTDYLGPFTLLFEQAVSAWWIGRKDEAHVLFDQLKNMPGLTEEYRAAVQTNLSRI